jgi:hypothetical protein
MSWEKRWLSAEDVTRTRTQTYVMGFVVIVLAILIITLFGRSSERANKTVCAGNLKDISLALEMYAQDNDNSYPPPDNWVNCSAEYVKSLISFTCPSDKNIRLKNKKGILNFVSYWYLPPESGDSNDIVAGDRMLWTFLGNHDDGGNIVFKDTHTEWKTLQQWQDESLPLEENVKEEENKQDKQKDESNQTPLTQQPENP